MALAKSSTLPRVLFVQAKFLYRHLETEVEERVRARYSLEEHGGEGAHSPLGRAGGFGSGATAGEDSSAYVRVHVPVLEFSSIGGRGMGWIARRALVNVHAYCL